MHLLDDESQRAKALTGEWFTALNEFPSIGGQIESHPSI